MTITEAVDAFIYDRKIRGAVEKTREDYVLHTQSFVAFVGSEMPMLEITQAHLNGFLESVYSSNLARSSMSSYIRDTKIFLKWYSQEYDVIYDYKKIKVPKMPKVERYIYSNDEILLIFRSIKTNALHTTARNKAIVAVMLDSGIRQQEVCNLRREDINFYAMRMKIHGKGDKERYVPLGKLSAKLIKEYWQIRPHESDFAFLNTHGKPLTCNAIKSMTGDLQKILPFEFSSHKLRHNFATNWLVDQYHAHGFMDGRRLAIIMGHENESTTNRYLHVAERIVASENSISHLDTYLLDMI